MAVHVECDSAEDAYDASVDCTLELLPTGLITSEDCWLMRVELDIAEDG